MRSQPCEHSQEQLTLDREKLESAGAIEYVHHSPELWQREDSAIILNLACASKFSQPLIPVVVLQSDSERICCLSDKLSHKSLNSRETYLHNFDGPPPICF